MNAERIMQCRRAASKIRPGRRLPVDKITDPVMRKTFELVDETHLPVEVIARRVGCGMSSLNRWRREQVSPSLFLLRMLLEELGYELVIQKKAGRSSGGAP